MSAQAPIVAVTCLDSENCCHQHLVLQEQPEQLPWCAERCASRRHKAVQMLLSVGKAGQNPACKHIR